MFVTTSATILAALYTNPDQTFKELARAVNLTERRCMEIVVALQAAGFIHVGKSGRRNVYTFPSKVGQLADAIGVLS